MSGEFVIAHIIIVLVVVVWLFGLFGIAVYMSWPWDGAIPIALIVMACELADRLWLTDVREGDL